MNQASVCHVIIGHCLNRKPWGTSATWKTRTNVLIFVWFVHSSVWVCNYTILLGIYGRISSPRVRTVNHFCYLIIFKSLLCIFSLDCTYSGWNRITVLVCSVHLCNFIHNYIHSMDYGGHWLHLCSQWCWITSLANYTLFLFSDLQNPLALEALSHQQQAARLGQWGEAARPFLPGNVAFPVPQQLAHLAQSGMARFPHQLLRAATWGHSANMDDEAVPSASAGPNFNRLDLIGINQGVTMISLSFHFECFGWTQIRT